MNIRKIFKSPSGYSFCFYCNVDSQELKTFLIVVIGGLVAASVFVALGAWLSGQFENSEDPKLKGRVLEIEEQNDGR